MVERECKPLHDALRDVRARLAPPQRDTSYQGAQAPIVLDPTDRTPDASDEVHIAIRQLEQAIREAGCDPSTDHDDDDGDLRQQAPAATGVHYEGLEQAGPPLGVEVQTQDGKDLGRVQQVLGDYVRVGDEQEEHWFPIDELGPIEDNALRTTFPGADILTHAVPAPDHTPESSQTESVLADTEREQREVMLRQTAEQRARLHSDDTEMPDERDTIGEPVEQELARMRSQDTPTSPSREN